MAVLDQIQPIQALGPAGVRDLVATVAWDWFRQNLDRVVLRKWIIAIRVRDLRQLFETLFGPEPAQ